MNNSPSSSLYPVCFPSKEPKTLSPAVPHGMHRSGVTLRISYSSIPVPDPASLRTAMDARNVFCMTRLSAGTRPVRTGESPADTSLSPRHHSSPMARILSSGLKAFNDSSSWQLIHVIKFKLRQVVRLKGCNDANETLGADRDHP